jgi:hypothetical protein
VRLSVRKKREEPKYCSECKQPGLEKSIWSLKVPSKIKIFGWRVLHGIIPCRGVLANRHIGNQGGCPICSLQCEDIKHMLFNCTRADEIWRNLGIKDQLNEFLNADRSGSIVIQDIIMRGAESKTWIRLVLMN